MDIIIKEAKKTNGLFQIKVYDCEFCEYKIVENIYFEDEETAEKYGREHYSYDHDFHFVEVVKAISGEISFYCEDGNHPGWIEKFDSKEKMNKFIEEMNSTEGTCFIPIDPDEIKNYYEEPEEPEDEEFWAEEEQKWKDEEECRADLVWEEMEDNLLGRRRRQ